MPDPSTYAQLIERREQSAIAEDILLRLEARGITSKGWTEADVRRALVEVIADIRESEEYKRVDVINSGFLDKAVGPLLDLLGVGFFDEKRLPASAATIQLELSDDVAQGPYDVQAGAIAVIGAGTDTPLYYRLVSSLTIPQDGTKSGQFLAVAAGADYNALSGTPVKLATPIPGVSIAATYVAALSGVVVVAGTDAESDTSYRQRLRDKWSIIAAGWTDGAIRFYIRELLPNATRIRVRDDGPATGEAWAYCAGPTAPISTADAVAAAAYLNTPGRKPVSNRNVRVMPAIALIVERTITLYTDGGETTMSLAASRLAAATRDYTASTLPMSLINDALYDPANGVYNVTIDPYEDVVLAAEEVPSILATYVEELWA
jgi:hypothetical protein